MSEPSFQLFFSHSIAWSLSEVSVCETEGIRAAWGGVLKAFALFEIWWDVTARDTHTSLLANLLNLSCLPTSEGELLRHDHLLPLSDLTIHVHDEKSTILVPVIHSFFIERDRSLCEPRILSCSVSLVHAMQ